MLRILALAPALFRPDISPLDSSRLSLSYLAPFLFLQQHSSTTSRSGFLQSRLPFCCFTPIRSVSRGGHTWFSASPSAWHLRRPGSQFADRSIRAFCS